MSSPQEAAPTWEQMKENAAPLERGRNVPALEKAFQSSVAGLGGTASVLSLSSLILGESKRSHDPHSRERLRHEELIRLSEESGAAAALSSTVTGATTEMSSLHEIFENNGHDNNPNDDPLIHWLSYIKFQQDTYPADTRGAFLLLERCVRAFCHLPRYANDVRFVRICATYADMTDHAAEVFQHLYRSCRVGTQVAIFWVAWAWVVEKEGNFSGADKIFLKGISKGMNAQSTTFLRQRHQQFLRRLRRHEWKSRNDRNETDDGNVNDDLDGRTRRGALGGLTSDALRTNDRSGIRPLSGLSTARPSISTFTDRSLQTRPHLQQSTGLGSRLGGAVSSTSSSVSEFEIFSDENQNTALKGHQLFLDDSGLGHEFHLVPARPVERDADRRKENTALSEHWPTLPKSVAPGWGMNPVSIPVPFTSLTQPLAFPVYIDEECAAKHALEERNHVRLTEQKRRLRDERILLQERSAGGLSTEEKLLHDPLRYLRNPQQLLADQQQANVDDALRNSRLVKDSKLKEKDNVATNIERPRALSTFKCDASRFVLGVDEFGLEECVEEARFKHQTFRLVSPSSNINLLRQKCIQDDSEMSLDNSDMSMDCQQLESTDACSTTLLPDLVAIETTRAAEIPSFHRHALQTRTVVFDQSVDSDVFGVLPTPSNLSTASSTVDEATAVGLPAQKDEQTINTQVALKELSMMFASPGVTGVLVDSSHVSEQSRIGSRFRLNSSTESYQQDHSDIRSGLSLFPSSTPSHELDRPNRQGIIDSISKQPGVLNRLKNHGLSLQPTGFQIYNDCHIEARHSNLDIVGYVVESSALTQEISHTRGNVELLSDHLTRTDPCPTFQVFCDHDEMTNPRNKAPIPPFRDWSSDDDTVSLSKFDDTARHRKRNGVASFKNSLESSETEENA